MNIILRKWEPLLLTEYEFRCFVVDNKITAITQYYNLPFLDLLARSSFDKALAQEKICDFVVKQVIPRLSRPPPSYTVDVAINLTAEKIWLIEVGFPPPTAGTTFFDWNNSNDQAILIGAAPFEFRTLKKPWEASSALKLCKADGGDLVAPLVDPSVRSFLRLLRAIEQGQLPKEWVDLSHAFACNLCRVAPIRGPRFFYQTRDLSFDLCFACYSDCLHSPHLLPPHIGIHTSRPV